LQAQGITKCGNGGNLPQGVQQGVDVQGEMNRIPCLRMGQLEGQQFRRGQADTGAAQADAGVRVLS
jgi:hypothetical protein